MNEEPGKTLLQLTVAMLAVALAFNVVMLRTMNGPNEFVADDVEHLAGFYQRMEALEKEVESQR